MTPAVVIPCHRQERYLPRTVAAVERALEGRAWHGVLVRAGPSREPLPALSERWQVLSPPVARPLTPGAARMLGWSACVGDWVLFLDADVEVDAAWLAEAIEVAGRSPSLGGLGGRLEEWFVTPEGERAGSRDLYRVGRDERRVEYLATLALYRRDALLAAGGYDPRLSSEEDFELGLRFARLGLELRSLGRLAARHWSGPRPSFAELGRRWRSGLCFGQGQVLRLYAGRPGFARLLRRQGLYLATLAVWAVTLAALAVALVVRDAGPALRGLAPALAVVGLMAARKRSLRLGLHAFLTWTLNGAGMVVGLFRLPAGDRAPLRPESRRC